MRLAMRDRALRDTTRAPAYLRSAVLNGARSALRHGKVVDRHAARHLRVVDGAGARRRACSPRTSNAGSSPRCGRSPLASARRWPSSSTAS